MAALLFAATGTAQAATDRTAPELRPPSATYIDHRYDGQGDQVLGQTMQAVVLSGPGPVENLRLSELPMPQPGPGWVRIQVKAFGINRSELHTRLGLAEGVTFPRVPGIEAAGIVDAAPPGSAPRPGQQVVTMMGGMGRVFDGGYAEYTSVPQAQVLPITTDLPWEVVGALPGNDPDRQRLAHHRA